ncbi:zinc finger, CCHC-type containing protein [Tanacetum coccineum]
MASDMARLKEDQEPSTGEGDGGHQFKATLSTRLESYQGTPWYHHRSQTPSDCANGCSMLPQTSSEDPNQHLKHFLKLVDSLDLDGENKERTRMRLFQFSLRDQASNWLERLPAGSITTWEDLTTRFLA